MFLAPATLRAAAWIAIVTASSLGIGCNQAAERPVRAATRGERFPDVKVMGLDGNSVAISEAGVDFNALDKQPVYSILLLLSPEDQPEEHLDAMEAIFGHLSNETFRSFLRQAKSVDDVITLLEEADAKASVR